jgi:hypothetical protein
MSSYAKKRFRGQSGAVEIKTVLAVGFIVVAIVVLIKIIPVYFEQREITYETDELARKAALGLTVYSPAKINQELEEIQHKHELPEGSLALGARTDNSAQISVKYTKNIDFFITNYSWTVDYVSNGKGL